MFLYDTEQSEAQLYKNEYWNTDTALRDIKDLIEKGILQQEEGGGRNVNYTLQEWKCTATNERFHASGGSLRPAYTYVRI